MFVHKDLQGKVSLRYFWGPFDCKQAPFFVDTLEQQEAALLLHAARIPGQAPVRAYNPVAGDDDTDRVMAYRSSDRLRRHARDTSLPGDFPGELLVGNDFAIRYFAQ